MASELKYDAELRDWTGSNASDRFKLSGSIYYDKMAYGAHPFPDGTVVTISSVLYIESHNNHQDKVAVTARGSRYLLR